MPLLALFTGARLEELGQLRVDDVREENGCWYFNITDLGENQQVKTATSRRRVPVHSQLIRAGLLLYWQDLRGRGEARLFPDLNSGIKGKVTASWSKWWGRYLRNVIGITDKRLVFHSFRHTFKDACRDAAIDEAIHDALTGHAGGGVGRKYGGRYPLVPLNQAMEKLDYKGLSVPVVMADETANRGKS